MHSERERGPTFRRVILHFPSIAMRSVVTIDSLTGHVAQLQQNRAESGDDRWWKCVRRIRVFNAGEFCARVRSKLFGWMRM